MLLFSAQNCFPCKPKHISKHSNSVIFYYLNESHFCKSPVALLKGRDRSLFNSILLQIIYAMTAVIIINSVIMINK